MSYVFFVCRMWPKPLRAQKKSKIALLTRKFSSKPMAEAFLPDQRAWYTVGPASLLHHKSYQKHRAGAQKSCAPDRQTCCSTKFVKTKGKEHKEAVLC